MKKIRRILSVLLMISILVGVLSIGTVAAEKNSSIQIIEQGGKQYYLSDPAEGESAGKNNFDVWTSKSIAGTDNEDEFVVTLQVGTTMKAIPNDVAVVLVMDASGSMMTDKDGKIWGQYGELPTDGRKLRIDYAREAALEFANQLVDNSGGAQRMLSVVEFGRNAMTVLPWTDANANGSLNKKVEEAISSVDVNFVIDEQSFWDEEFLKTWEYEVYDTLIIWGGVSQQVKAENWSDELYTHETKNFFEADFVSHDQSFTTEYTTVLVTETVDGVETTRCTYEGCVNSEPHTHCAYEGCTDNTVGHKHCDVCGVTDTTAPDDSHCTYAGCKETAPHTHCTYSICANPAGHTHCERWCNCEVAHEHCWDIQAVCGRTDEHQHMTGCTVFFCQDTTPNHKHACLHGAVKIDKSVYQYPFFDYKGGSEVGTGAAPLAAARCLNPDPDHKHPVYDADDATSAYLYLGTAHQKYSFCGTNMEGGLMLARNLVNAGKADGGAIEGIEDVYVVLLSDGCPTFHVNQELLQNADTEVKFFPAVRGGGNYSHWDDLKDIVSDGTDGDVAIAEDLKAISDFYAIMYGTEMGQKLGYTLGGAHYGAHELYATTALEWFQTANDPENGRFNFVGAHEVFISTQADELNTVFADIKNRIDVLAKAWTVSDVLSDDVSFVEFLQNGEYADVTPASESKEASVSWSLGNMEPESGSGSMADPYIYTLKYKVRLNSAQDDVKAASLAHDADNTLDGVWTGNNTNLQYFMIEKDELDTMKPEDIQKALRGAAFEDVSVKGLYGDYTFVKKNGETEEPMENVGFTLHTADEAAYGSEIRSDAEGTIAFTDVPRGTYKLKETTVPEGMQQMADLELQVSWGEFLLADGRPAPEVILNWAIGTEPDDPDDPFVPDWPERPDRPDTPDLPTEPNDTPVVELPDEEVPAAETPVEETTEDLVEIPDEDVPLYDSPPTGDRSSAIWLFLMAGSAVGVLAIGVVMLGGRKRTEK